MNDPLATYLADHLAGSVHATEFLRNVSKEYGDDSLGRFAADLLIEVEADQKVLQDLADRVGDGSSSLKEATAWLGEKVSRLKLGSGSAKSLGIFEGLEFLEVGIHGKWALWRALASLEPADTRLQGLDYQHLMFRAQAQHDTVDAQRLAVAPTALNLAPK